MSKHILLTLCCLLALSGLQGQINDRFQDRGQPSDTSQPAVPPQRKPLEKVVQKDQQKAPFWEKTVIGGDLSLRFGSYTAVYLAPTVGYRFSDKLTAGPGFIYQYFKWNQVYDPNTNRLISVDGYANTIYGPKAFVNYAIHPSVYVGSQYEYLNHDYYTYQSNGPPLVDNRWTSVFFLELGLRSELGKKGFTMVGLRYNVLHDFTSPYSSAWFPVVAFFF